MPYCYRPTIAQAYTTPNGDIRMLVESENNGNLSNMHINDTVSKLQEVAYHKQTYQIIRQYAVRTVCRYNHVV